MSDLLVFINEYLDILFIYGSVWVYLAILAACFIENLFPPFPGDAFIVAGGGLVAMSHLDASLVLAAVVTGGIASVMLIYFMGRRFGRKYFLRKNFRFFRASDVEAVEAKFERYGALMLLASRFVVGLRVALALGAGIGIYPVVRMLIYTLISYLLFAGLLMFLGYTLVENLDSVEYFVRTYNYIVWPIIVALILFYVFRRIKANRVKESE